MTEHHLKWAKPDEYDPAADIRNLWKRLSEQATEIRQAACHFCKQPTYDYIWVRVSSPPNIVAPWCGCEIVRGDE